MSDTVIVIVEQTNGSPAPAAYEALSLAVLLSERMQINILGATIGIDAKAAADQVSADSGMNMVAVETDSPYNGETTKYVLEQLAMRYNPSHIIATGTSQGMDYGPGLAVRLKGSCITGVRGITTANGSIAFIREVQAGKLHAIAVPSSQPTIILVQPGIFSNHDWKPQMPGSVDTLNISLPQRQTRNVEAQTRETGKSDLGDAEIIVAVGRGVGKPENLELANQLAALFQRSAVAGSRPVCDSGWLEYRKQVGITGQTVAPKLYIAAGISGASQHVSAMAGSGIVVSINNDPQAAIFNVSDVCIVEDMIHFIPMLINSLNNLPH